MIDAAIVDGVSSLMTFFAGLLPRWTDLTCASQSAGWSGAELSLLPLRGRSRNRHRPAGTAVLARAAARMDAPEALWAGCADPPVACAGRVAGAAVRDPHPPSGVPCWRRRLFRTRAGTGRCAAASPSAPARGLSGTRRMMQAAPAPRFSRAHRARRGERCGASTNEEVGLSARRVEMAKKPVGFFTKKPRWGRSWCCPRALLISMAFMDKQSENGFQNICDLCSNSRRSY